MTAILKQFQATPPPASVKAVEEICVTCGGPHPYYQCLAADGNTFSEYQDNIQGYVAAATGNYNQGNAGYRPPGVVNQTRPPGFVQQNGQNNQNRFSQPQGYNRGNNFNQNANYQAPIQQNQSVPLSELEKFKKINDVNMKAMQAQINNVKNELRNEMQSSIQASMSNQTNELKNMMASFFQMNTASTSGTGSLPSNTVANPKGELKAITTRSGLVLDGPTIPMPPPFINPEEDERVEETLTDPEHGEYTIKVPPPQVQKAKPPSQRNFVIHQRDPRYPHIPYPSRMNQEKQKEKDEEEQNSQNFLQIFSSIVDSEINPRVPHNWKTFLMQPARALIDVHGEEMILRDGDERLILNMRNDTLRYSNTPQKESINMIDIYNISNKEYLEDLLANEKITNHPNIIENLLNLDKTKDLPPYHDNPLSGSTTSSLPSLLIYKTSDYFLEEFADELTLITFPLVNDDLPFDAESDLREIEYLLNHDPIEEMDSILEDSVDKNSPDDNLDDTISEIFPAELRDVTHSHHYGMIIMMTLFVILRHR
ncbi:hypothetical protein Tco_0897740 [Tanacetum coccineum]